MPFVYAIRLPYSQPILSIKLGVDPYDFFKALNCYKKMFEPWNHKDDLEISFFGNKILITKWGHDED